ncbi:hypothetical protein FHQ18_06790 [Deferribacter autotrophicus]|uniref:Tetratricopeptide repeat protein n=1 Tax=Deferribacter autotrophicus TaxID=500465 RepID=A0A5A8F7X8_9BACT|nr:hypothetical protein [Deferribacter autotrophicus]KAA0258098.1 hypothetical protein FHQ18_06790 [Deferribacter autotrophicus]
MLKRLIVFCFFIFTFFSTYAEDSSDYFLAVSTYKDGFYDVAEMSLHDYLKDAEDKKKILFANYLLYKINFKKKNFDEALKYIELIENTKDERINFKDVKADKLLILATKDCKVAKRYLDKNFFNETLAAYLKSNCSVDKDISKESLKLRLPNDMRLLLAVKLKDYPDEVVKQFSKLNVKKIANKYKKSFAVYFYKNKKYDYFWKIYNLYKDSDLVNLALERVWNLKRYDSFVKSFEINRKKFRVNSVNYCRAYEAYRKLGKSADCNLLDKCFKKKDGAYYKAKLSCYQTNNDKEGFVKTFSITFNKYRNVACEFGVYGYEIGKVGINDLQKCDNRYDIAEQLIADEKGEAVLKLMSVDNSDKGKYYKVLAYLLLEDTNSAEKVFNSIKDEKIKKELLKLLQ